MEEDFPDIDLTSDESDFALDESEDDVSSSEEVEGESQIEQLVEEYLENNEQPNRRQKPGLVQIPDNKEKDCCFRRKRSATTVCRLCGEENEDCSHVLFGCGELSGIRETDWSDITLQEALWDSKENMTGGKTIDGAKFGLHPGPDGNCSCSRWPDTIVDKTLPRARNA
ncbi:hypothetical protein PoB_003953800 [Plakobranchus ocellatus]|uniref:Uncharacterized protein n=1 Tax=Plakobranchus ocellatus TaxID=259542 RepID=A0AAV4B2T1_9GAST|nr:hypothetical protein PoB_003953800 [Plakobranchus ocellatus]